MAKLIRFYIVDQTDNDKQSIRTYMEVDPVQIDNVIFEESINNKDDDIARMILYLGKWYEIQPISKHTFISLHYSFKKYQS